MAENTFCTRKFDLLPGDSKVYYKNKDRSRYVTYLGRACGVITHINAHAQKMDYVSFSEWRIELWIQSEHDGPRAFQLFKQRFRTAGDAAEFLKENASMLTAIFDLWHPAENPWEKYNGITK